MPANIYKNAQGKKIPGVTTVISSNLGWNKVSLMYWSWMEGIENRDYRDTRDKAAATGTIAHAMVEADLKVSDWKDLVDLRGVDDSMLAQAESAFNAFKEWALGANFKLLKSEHLLVSEKYQFGGQIDVAAVQGRRAIIDLKTSNGVYGDHKIQIAAYSNLWDENYPDETIENHYILQLGKNGGFNYYLFPAPVIAAGWEAFKHLRALHDLKKQVK
jgi:hypothetical protein